METLYSIDIGYACFGIITKYKESINQEVITDSAPIFKKLQGQNIDIVKSWVEKKNGKIEKIKTIKTFNKNENKNKKLF